MTEPAFSLESTYMHLRPDERAIAMAGSGAFSGPSVADARPPGEIGAGVLESAETNTAMSRARGQAFIVPKGVWHRGIVQGAGRLMSLTAGAGTEHRPVSGRG